MPSIDPYAGGLPYSVVLKYVPEAARKNRARTEYLEARARRMSGLRRDEALRNDFADRDGARTPYSVGHLAYDIRTGRLREVHRFDVHGAHWLTEDTAYALADTARRRLARRGRLSTCATPIYLARHPMSDLRPCSRHSTCKALGVGRGSHCVTRRRRHALDAAYDAGEAQAHDLSAFLCARMGLP